MPFIELIDVDSPTQPVKVNYTHGEETLGWLRRQIADQHGLVGNETASTILIWHDDRILTSFEDLTTLDSLALHNSSWFVKKLPKPDPNLTLRIRTTDPIPKSVPVAPTDTVDDLKLRLLNLESIHRSVRLLFGSKELANSMTIADCIARLNISPQLSILDAVYPVLGGRATLGSEISTGLTANGIQFADLSNPNALQRFDFNELAPNWRTASHGLNFEGDCRNPNCKAYAQRVVIPWNRNHWDAWLDLQESKCPACASWVQPVTCGFVKCWWKFVGMCRTSADAPPRVFEYQAWQKADNAYHAFAPKKSGTAFWARLKIFVKPYGEVSPAETECVICFGDMSEKARKRLACGHVFHGDCIGRWERKMGKEATCPICREPIPQKEARKSVVECKTQ